MENMGLNLKELREIYSGRRVMVTGHTGFKGSWLSGWLTTFKAKVLGYSLEPVAMNNDNHWLQLRPSIESVIADIRDQSKLKQVIEDFQPEIIFHLAARPLVRESYLDPVDTYTTNMMGLVNLLELVRKHPCVKSVVNVTTDKCYLNTHKLEGYTESDPLGGHDPYSSSKACAEIITASYRQSFFSQNSCLMATARAGNVVGGGDWSLDRLFPDIVKHVFLNKSLVIRNKNAIRPWQHVLEPLWGYLVLGAHLWRGDVSKARAYNFGPSADSCVPVKMIIDKLSMYLDQKISYEDLESPLHEASLLTLDSSLASNDLRWSPKLDLNETLSWSMNWYRQYYVEKKLITFEQIENYERKLSFS